MTHGSLLKRAWMLPVLVAILIAVHGIALYRLFSHMAWTVVLGLVLLVLLKHIGVFGPVYAFLRRRYRGSLRNR